MLPEDRVVFYFTGGGPMDGAEEPVLAVNAERLIWGTARYGPRGSSPYHYLGQDPAGRYVLRYDHRKQP